MENTTFTATERPKVPIPNQLIRCSARPTPESGPAECSRGIRQNIGIHVQQLRPLFEESRPAQDIRTIACNSHSDGVGNSRCSRDVKRPTL